MGEPTRKRGHNIEDPKVNRDRKPVTRQTLWRHRKLKEAGRQVDTLRLIEEFGGCNSRPISYCDNSQPQRTVFETWYYGNETPIERRKTNAAASPVHVSANATTRNLQCLDVLEDAGNAWLSDIDIESDTTVSSESSPSQPERQHAILTATTTAPQSLSHEESDYISEVDTDSSSTLSAADAGCVANKKNFNYARTAENIRDYIGSGGDKVMFRDANLKVSQVILVILGLCYRFSLSLKARRALIETAKLFAGAEFSDWDISDYYMYKIFDTPDGVIMYHFYCEVCCKQVEAPSSRDSFKPTRSFCNNCMNDYVTSFSSPNHFVSIDLKYQLTSLLNLNVVNGALKANLREIDKGARCDSDRIIRDVYDSILYKRLLAETPDDSVLLTYTFNTDGAPLFNSSKRSFWPISMTINELPVNLRFKYTLLVGLCIVRKEPSPDLMNTYLNSFVEQANKLNAEGFTMRLGNRNVHFVLKPFACTVDSVARPIVQNRLQFNEYYGCSWCYSIGIHKDGCMRFLAEEVDAPCRTHENYLRDARAAEKKIQAMQRAAAPRLLTIKQMKSNVRGVKGKAALSRLKNFDMIWGFVRDYLHGDLNGVASQMWSIWCDHRSNFHLSKAQQDEVNDRLMKMTPPNEVHRLVRPLKNEKCKWKASEWRSWLLFYAIPCLSGILDSYAVQHFALYVTSIYKLLKTSITEEELITIQYDLDRFVLLFEVMYGSKNMTFNIHSLRHLVRCVRYTGPIWATSTFPFESMIRNLKQHVHGPKGVYDQMAKKSAQMNVLRSIVQETEGSEECLSFHESLLQTSRVASCYKTTSGPLQDDSVVFLGIGRPHTRDRDGDICRCDANRECSEIRVYNRCIKSGMVIRSADEDNRQNRSNNTMFFDRTMMIVKVLKLPRHKDTALAQVSCYYSEKVVLGSDARNTEGISDDFVINDVVIDHLYEVMGHRCDAIIPVSHLLGKCVVISPTCNRLYVARLPNTIEIQ